MLNKKTPMRTHISERYRRVRFARTESTVGLFANPVAMAEMSFSNKSRIQPCVRATDPLSSAADLKR